MCSINLFYFNLTSVQNDSIKTLNVNVPNLQINKLKLGKNNGTELTLKISSNIVGDSNDESNYQHKLLLINTQVFKLRKPLKIIIQLI